MPLNNNLTNKWDFDPSLGELVLGAYARIGIRRTEVTTQHMADARFEMNMVFSDLQGDGINTWQVELVTQDIIAGQKEYIVPNTTVFVLDLYIRQNPDTFNPTDRLLIPFSRSDYAATANKDMRGFPTTYWYDRLLDPKLYLWPVPNFDIVGGLRYYVQKRPMDSDLQNGQQVQMPYEVYDAATWMLSERLAFIYAPDKIAMIGPRKQQAYQRMLQTTTENVPINMNIQMGSYFRVG
jgi:hypothetical protein